MRRLTITSVTPALSVVTGYDSRELIEELRGRAPMWCSNPRGWVIQPTTASDLAALAEVRGYLVVMEEGVEVR